MACNRIAAAPDGSANSILNAEAFSLGRRFVDTGHLDTTEVYNELLATAAAAGYPERKASAVIRQALSASRQKGAR